MSKSERLAAYDVANSPARRVRVPPTLRYREETCSNTGRSRSIASIIRSCLPGFTTAENWYSERNKVRLALSFLSHKVDLSTQRGRSAATSRCAAFAVRHSRRTRAAYGEGARLFARFRLLDRRAGYAT